MKKICAAVLVLLLFAVPTRVFAGESTDSMTEDGLRSVGYYELFSLLPEESGKVFAEGFSREILEDLSAGEVFDWLADTAKEKAAAPIRLFLLLTGVTFLAAMTDCFADQTAAAPLRQTLSSAAALTVTGILADRIIRTVSETAGIIEDLSYFMLSFIPVFAGAAAASGKPASAMVYHGTVFTAVQFFSQIAGNLILPLISIFLAFGFTASVTDVIKVDALSKGIRSCAGWILSLCLTVFIGLLTLKGLAAAPMDGLTVRTAKFVLSSFVPVVGSALSEAYASLFGCMGVVRSTVGVFGIAVMAVILLPVTVGLLLDRAALNLAAVLAEMLSQPRPAAVMRSCSAGISVLMAVVICYGMMILVSAALILLLGTG